MDRHDVAESVKVYEAVINHYNELKDQNKFEARVTEITKKITVLQGELADLMDKRTNADRRIEEAKQSIISIKSRLGQANDAKARSKMVRVKSNELTSLLERVAKLQEELGIR